MGSHTMSLIIKSYENELMPRLTGLQNTHTYQICNVNVSRLTWYL